MNNLSLETNKKPQTLALVPFYFDNKSPEFTQKRLLLDETLLILKGIVDRVVVVDDGANLDVEDLECSDLISLQKNQGKAQAIRVGLKGIIKRYPTVKYIIQVDADKDYDPNDSKGMLAKIKNLDRKGANKHIMIVGDRYDKNPDKIIEYRRCMLEIQNRLCVKMGYSVRDIVSGLRVYSLPLAKKFVKSSRSDNYGIEIEELIISFLNEAVVERFFLKNTRARDSYTLKNKLIENFSVFLMWKEALIDKGQVETVKFFDLLIEEIKCPANSFRIKLESLGTDRIIYFKKLDNEKITCSFVGKNNILLIDTSSNKAQICLADDEKVIAVEDWEVLRSLSDKLLPNIEKLLQKNKVKPEDLNGIIVYLGPGTFTGLRAGVTVANAFAYSLDIPISGVRGKSFGKEKFIVSELKPIGLETLLVNGKKIMAQNTQKIVTPFYGKKPNVG